MDRVRFYFSFRSPYAWLAFHLAPRVLAELPVELDLTPVFPPPDFPNDPTAVPQKMTYIREHDVPRLAEAYGFPLKPPAETDVDWMRPHAMWIYAADQGKGDAFGKGVYAARFSRGQSLADDDVLAAVARDVGLDPAATLAAGRDEAYHKRVMEGMAQALQDGIFGVPFFVYEGERFWGHDRIPWLIRAVRRAHGLPQPSNELLI